MGSWTSEGKVTGTSKGRALSSIKWGTPNFKLKICDGKLNYRDKGRGLLGGF